VSKTINGSTTEFLYDDSDVVQEKVSATPSANMLMGGLDQTVTRTDAGGTVNFLTDALGSTLSLTDRYLFTKKAEDIGALRTPSLRDVELTAPYMHNGSEKTLIDVVRFYNRGGNGNPNLDKRIVPLKLTDNEMSELVEFMRTLSSNDVLRLT